MKLLNEIEENNLFIPDTEWMADNYIKMNRLLFDGKLPPCHFDIFKTGRGSNGGVLGWFCLTRKGLKYSRKTRQIYLLDNWGYKEYVDYDNFFDICIPYIKLNGNYRWTEKAALSTLVHEMCHYYCEMYGYYPKQAHGREFRTIAAIVSSKSDGIFTVERIASAEQMNEMELDADIKVKNDIRKQNKENRIILMFIFMQNGEIRLVNANSMKLVDLILYNYNNNKYVGSNKVKEIKISTDNNLKKIVFENGYKKACTTYRYWEIQNKPFVKELDNYVTKTVLSTEPIQQTSSEKPQNSLIRHFMFTTVQGNTFEVKNVTKDDLKAKLRERFPRWSESAIERVINTEKYYR